MENIQTNTEKTNAELKKLRAMCQELVDRERPTIGTSLGGTESPSNSSERSNIILAYVERTESFAESVVPKFGLSFPTGISALEGPLLKEVGSLTAENQHIPMDASYEKAVSVLDVRGGRSRNRLQEVGRNSGHSFIVQSLRRNLTYPDQYDTIPFTGRTIGNRILRQMLNSGKRTSKRLVTQLCYR